MHRPTDGEKEELWRLYYERRAPRPPVIWGANIRVCLLDPAVNTEGWTFERCWADPEAAFAAGLRFLDYTHDVLHRHSDRPTSPPERYTLGLDRQNVTDGAYFGGSVIFPEDQVPAQEPFLGFDDAERFLATPFRPEDNPYLRELERRHAELAAVAQGRTHHGRPVDIAPLGFGFDGPVTTAAMIFGGDIFALLGAEPELAERVLEKITRDVLRRNRYANDRAGLPAPTDVGLADDSIQLISTALYRERVLPWHRLYYEETAPAAKHRSIHLCGDATRHFPVIRDELGVTSFDTGDPVDHGALRRALGPDIQIHGGPPVAVFTRGTPETVAAAARRVLDSGVTAGGRFIFREGNNLPPRVPEANLAAAYEEALRTPL